MPRTMLNDKHWSKLRKIMRENKIYDKPNLRKTVEGILYRMRTGCPWRDLPSYFGSWNSVFQQFNRWSKKEKLMKIFKNLIEDPDLEWGFMDGSYIRAHQHSAGAQGKGDQAIGLSRGGKTTKIHLVVDSFGLPIHFEIKGGQIHDCTQASDLLENMPTTQYIIADKGYDSKPLRQIILAKDSTPVIPRKSNSKIGNDDMDWGLYKYRHLVENTFARLKHFRAVATRFDKLERNYRAIVALACSYIWLPL